MKTQFVAELFREYQERKSRSRGYSERAFARDIGLSPGFLKLLMQRKKKISADRARKVARTLMWSEEKIAFLTSEVSIHDLDFLEITDWYHFAVIEMLRTSKTGLTADEMGRRLGITRSEVDYAMKHLQSTRGDSREGETKLQRQTLTKAIEALDNQPTATFRTECLAFDPARAEEVRTFFEKVVEDFKTKFSEGDRTAISQLNLAFHRLDKPKR
jgi:cyanate lyase